MYAYSWEILGWTIHTHYLHVICRADVIVVYACGRRTAPGIASVTYMYIRTICMQHRYIYAREEQWIKFDFLPVSSTAVHRISHLPMASAPSLTFVLIGFCPHLCTRCSLIFTPIVNYFDAPRVLKTRFQIDVRFPSPMSWTHSHMLHFPSDDASERARSFFIPFFFFFFFFLKVQKTRVPEDSE